MTPRETAAQERRIRAIIKKWRTPAGMTEWFMKTQYTPGPIDIDGKPDPEVAALTSTDWEYRQTVIKFNLDMMARCTDDEAERIVLHEFCHVLVNEMHEGSEERVVTTLSFIFQWIRDAAKAGKI